MSKFRVKMATLEAEKLVGDLGFDSFPILPEEIAESQDIELTAKPPDVEGVSGGIVFVADTVTIFYSTAIKSHGFQRFTIGHELGHYFLSGHPEEIKKQGNGFHISRAGYSQGDNSIEIEADHFASGLLMPRNLTKKLLRSAGSGLAAIEELSNEAETSLTSAAIRTAECVSSPMAIIMSSENRIEYGFLSDDFKALKPGCYPRKGMALPYSATLEFNANNANVQNAARATDISSLEKWFGGDADIELHEEVIGLGSYGRTLTVLSAEQRYSDDHDEDADFEKELEDSWTPKFAYGR